MALREFWVKLAKYHPLKHQVCKTEPLYLGAYGQQEFYEKINVREISPELDVAHAECETALEFISCDGMDDGDFYAEEEITAGTIAMANRARSALAALRKAREK